MWTSLTSFTSYHLFPILALLGPNIFETIKYLQSHLRGIHQWVLHISPNAVAIHRIHVKICFAPNIWKQFLHPDSKQLPLRSFLLVRNRKESFLGCKKHEESLPPRVRSRNPEHTALHACTHYRDAAYFGWVVYTASWLQTCVTPVICLYSTHTADHFTADNLLLIWH